MTSFFARLNASFGRPHHMRHKGFAAEVTVWLKDTQIAGPFDTIVKEVKYSEPIIGDEGFTRQSVRETHIELECGDLAREVGLQHSVKFATWDAREWSVAEVLAITENRVDLRLVTYGHIETAFENVRAGVS